MTTKDIIKILPLDKDFKNKLLDEFDQLNPDQKNAVGQILWKAYRDLYKIKRDANLQLAFLRAKNNQEKLDKDFYRRVREQTGKEMEQEVLQTTTQVDLAETREELQAIISQSQTPQTTPQPQPTQPAAPAQPPFPTQPTQSNQPNDNTTQ